VVTVRGALVGVVSAIDGERMLVHRSTGTDVYISWTDIFNVTDAAVILKASSVVGTSP
jgi:hypothetical protein